MTIDWQEHWYSVKYAPYRLKTRLKDYQRRLVIQQFVKHTWWSFDTALAEAVSVACDYYLTERHGETISIYPVDSDSDSALCPSRDDIKRYNDYVYKVLKELADEAHGEDFFDDEYQDDFLEAYAEAVKLGYLWD
jgi:hypothetical protein